MSGIKQSVCLACLCLHDTLGLSWPQPYPAEEREGDFDVTLGDRCRRGCQNTKTCANVICVSSLGAVEREAAELGVELGLDLDEAQVAHVRHRDGDDGGNASAT